MSNIHDRYSNLLGISISISEAIRSCEACIESAYKIKDEATKNELIADFASIYNSFYRMEQDVEKQILEVRIIIDNDIDDDEMEELRQDHYASDYLPNITL